MKLLASFLAAVIVSSFLEYAVHRLMHVGVMLHARHVAHHKDGWGQGFWPELRDYLLPGLAVILPSWFLGASIGAGWTMGCALSACFMAYAHQLQHDNPRACRWMRLPVHYVHHRDQMWHHNFGLAFDVWDRVFGTYKVVPFGDEFCAEERAGGPFAIHWRKVDEAQAEEAQRAARARRAARQMESRARS
jgi:sterol desaturase/sphingolipid hydroxylase (fatty acid hydroxylase superfamily)